MKRLRIEREARGLSRVELSRKAGMSEVTYGKVELGTMPPYPKYRAAIAEALGWTGDPMELFEDVEDGGRIDQH